jgi:hypothetical protein
MSEELIEMGLLEGPEVIQYLQCATRPEPTSSST